MVWEVCGNKHYEEVVIMAEVNVQEERLIRAGTNAVCWFEIPIRDVARAKAFYEHTLGITLEAMPPCDECEMLMFPMEKGQPGAGGTLVKSPQSIPCDKGTTIYFNVTDIQAVLDRARQNGGKVVMEKTGIGEYGYFAVLEDPDGNHLGVHSMT